ncbi:MAG TPA: 6-phosphogluconolactonase [Bacteroides sp.]|nr:6-phosphogluconolactonase [Bacteroides sp.]
MSKHPHYIYPDTDSLAGAVICELQNFVGEAAETERPLYLALSGGSTPLAIFRKIRAAGLSVERPNICFCWGDERCVPPDDPDSNYGNASELMLEPLRIPRSQIFRIRGEDEPEQEADRYGQLLLDRLPQEQGIPVFDWIWLGIGQDGHTASLFPGQTDLWNASGPCVVAQHPQSGQLRISITGNVINAAKRVTFLITGRDKAGIVKEIIFQEGRFREYPAASVNPVSGRLEWYMDREAASQL